MRKFLLGVLSLFLICSAGFFIFAPTMLDRELNAVDGKPLPEISEKAITLHQTLTIVDLHSDSLLWNRNILERHDYGHMDLPRLEDGNVALQVFSSVTKTPAGQNFDRNEDDSDNITWLALGQLQPVRTWTSLLERSLYHGQKLDRAVAASNGDLIAVRLPADIDALLSARSRTDGPVGGLFSAEGLHNLEGDLTNLDTLYAAGMRMAGLTHFFDNQLAGSMHGTSKGGLTDLGREAVLQMEAKGIIVDIAHCSRQCVDEILGMARRPVVSSHGGVQATCNVNRNLSDKHIRGVAATGGVIGIGYWEGAVCDTSPKAIARAMKHVRDLVGIEHVALGSDFDGTITTRFDTAGLIHVTQALIDEGFGEDDIRAVMGGNALRVLRSGLKPLSMSMPEVTVP